MRGILSNNSAQRRYELRDGEKIVAIAEYRLNDGEITFTHTEVAAEHEGKGYASDLARQALDDAGRCGMRVVPLCKFIAEYIRRHQEYANLLAPPRE